MDLTKITVTAPEDQAAIAEHARRDAMWNDPPPLKDGCNHDYQLLPVIEPRLTVVCWRCGGLNPELSRELAQRPELFVIQPDGGVARLRDRLTEIEDAFASRTRHFNRLAREYDGLVDQVTAGLSTPEHEKIMVAGLPRCRCGCSLAGGRASEAFITHALAVLAGTRRGEAQKPRETVKP